MAITLVGTVKNATGTSGQRSVTLDATDVRPGDVMIWAAGTNAAYAYGSNVTECRSGYAGLYELNGISNNGATQRVCLFAYVCDGTEESQTFTSNSPTTSLTVPPQSRLHPRSSTTAQRAKPKGC